MKKGFKIGLPGKAHAIWCIASTLATGGVFACLAFENSAVSRSQAEIFIMFLVLSICFASIFALIGRFALQPIPKSDSWYERACVWGKRAGLFFACIVMAYGYVAFLVAPLIDKLVYLHHL